MSRQAIGGGFPFPVYVNETATDQRIATGGLYVDETVAAGTIHNLSVSVASAQTIAAAKLAARTISVASGETVAKQLAASSGQIYVFIRAFSLRRCTVVLIRRARIASGLE